MSSVIEVFAALGDAELAVMAKECLGWDKSGLLAGSAVQAFADRLGGAVGLDEAWPLDELPKLIYQETARRFVAAH